MTKFLQIYPEINITMVADDRKLKLEYGEAHVAIRAGAKPDEPDNVAQFLMRFHVAFFAHRDYVARWGTLNGLDDIPNHRFVVTVRGIGRAPFHHWLNKNIPEKAIVYRATEMRSLEDAVHSGAGIGLLSLWSGQSNPDLVQVHPSLSEWDTDLWLVTHVDLHRSAKVQAFLTFIKEEVAQRKAALGLECPANIGEDSGPSV